MQIEQEVKDGIEAALMPLPKPDLKLTIHDFGRLLVENEPIKKASNAKRKPASF